MSNELAAPLKATGKEEYATFGQGCFWGVEHSFRKRFGNNGVSGYQVGYCGGLVDNPSYRQVCTGATNHAEVLQMVFDPSVVSYETLIDFFYRSHDPTTLNQQGNDRGTQYRSAIFYQNAEQKAKAEVATAAANLHYGGKIKTTIEPIGKVRPC
jgi:peptide-methionine (S)-S-oxide reductase